MHHIWYTGKWMKAVLTTVLVLLMVWLGKSVVVGSTTVDGTTVAADAAVIMIEIR